jgi:hypothetical protein
MAKTQPDNARLKITMNWQDAANKLIHTPAKSTPPRTTKPRKKPIKSKR